MSEIRDVLEAIESLNGRGERMALATIVSVRGSTYRRPGARLLVPEAGELVGNISGGCLEGDVADVAKVVMAGGEARLVSFDLTADDEAVWGWGLGCNGAIEVFVEPADRAAEVAGALRAALEEERQLAVVTVLESSAPGVERGGRLVVHPDGRAEGTLGDAAADRASRAEALAALGTGTSSTRELETGAGAIRTFVEVLEPPPRLFVCGAGHDAIPLVRFAGELGWRVVVVDDREEFLTSERFPQASAFIVTEPRDAAETAGVDGSSNVVVISHNYLRDKDYLRSFVGSDAAYIGMLGPRVRLERILADLAADGFRPSDEDLARVRGPAGLDLGAEGPEEIAWSIVSEILAVRRGRTAGFLRDRAGPIHERPGAPTPAKSR